MEESKEKITTTPEEIRLLVAPIFSNMSEISMINVGAKTESIKAIKKMLHEFSWILNLSEKVNYFELEYDEKYTNNKPNSFYGDICSCPQIPDDSFDLVFIYNVLEHTKEPWRAAEECVRICKSGGVIISGSPFAWYYHQHPIDLWRFTHEGLRYLFEKDQKVDLLSHGFLGEPWVIKNKMPKVKGLESVYAGKKR